MTTTHDEQALVPTETAREDFYRRLRRRMLGWLRRGGHAHRWADYLVLAPDLFYTLVNLLRDPAVPLPQKARIAGAVAYFMSPIDIIPEAIFGPVGYLDDITLAVAVLDDVVNGVDASVVRRAWPGDEDVLDVIQRVLDFGSRTLTNSSFRRLLGMVRGRGAGGAS